VTEEFKPTRHDDAMSADIFEHPSFGTISFSRCQGGDVALFGSSIKHMNTIRMEINHAELHRSLNRDWIMDRGHIVVAYMSPTQFVDAITMMNTGGQPITLDYVTGEKERIPDTPYFSKVEQFNQEFQDQINVVGKHFDDVLKLAKETNAQKRLIKEIEQLRMHFKNNLPFVNESFTEQMENTVKEAKGEVEAFVTGMIHNYGIEAIRKQTPQISEFPKDIKLLADKEKT
jgi:hypothetical protein